MNWNYDQLNKIIGWITFAIALTIFWLTVEPTISFWDAGEYIATSAMLEVGHPPGAPLYQMLGAFFSIFTTDATQIAYMVNLMSVFSSAFAVLFMFWSLTLLLRNHILKDKASDTMVLGSAMIGSLAFAVTDSFWFNAVEAEVYAMTTMLMSLMFYLGLLWERDMLKPRGNRWLILISFIIGLSFGVHFLGLLTIPAIGLLWYFKHYKKITPLNFILANVAVVAVLLFVFLFLGPNTLAIFGQLEIFFVNDIGLPFNYGTIIVFVLIVALFIYLITLSRKRNLPLLNTITLSIAFILIGFSSWVMLPIRSNAGVPINENRPEDARSLLAYYNREQYPKQTIFYGPSFTDRYVGLDPDEPYVDEKPKYERNDELGKYVIVNNYEDAAQNTHSDHKGFFPRMTDGSRATNYVEYMGELPYKIKKGYENNPQLLEVLGQLELDYKSGKIETNEYINAIVGLRDYITVSKPGFFQNVDYMLNYQISYMYLRYFMWNFTGRQNDVQGEWDPFNGNWISGIKFIDEFRLGNQDELSEDMLNNPARNTYFFLPLILGLLGAIFHFTKDKKSFYVTLVLFVFTGIAIIIYLNQAIFQVRERDYAYVGSFLVFSMWIGMGVYSIYEGLRDLIKSKPAQLVSLVACFAAAPLLMGVQNWDDHDRSGKYSALENARKYLDSCLPNAMIFTIGDNDTFPLWYLQEVENYRTDVRVVCTSLLSTAWYMDDMKKQAWDSAPVPSTLSHSDYTYGTRDVLLPLDKEKAIEMGAPKAFLKDTLDITDWMAWVRSNKRYTMEDRFGPYEEHTYPSKFIRVPVNKQAVLANGVVPEKDADKIVDEIIIELDSDYVYKNRMFMLDILAANNWERPIYFSGGAFGDEDYIWMKDYLQLDGCAYRLIPIKSEYDPRDPFSMGRVDADHGYEVLKSWKWGNSGNPDVLHDVETRRNSVGFRSNITRVATALTEEGKLDKAEEILDLGMEKMPLELFGHYSMIEPFVTGYYNVGKKEKARDLLLRVIAKYQDELEFYENFNIDDQGEDVSIAIITAVERYRNLVQSAILAKDMKFATEQIDIFNEYMMRFPKQYDPREKLSIVNTLSSNSDDLDPALIDSAMVELLRINEENTDLESLQTPKSDSLD